MFAHRSIGTIHVLRNQDLGFSDPTSLPFVITLSTEHNQKIVAPLPLVLPRRRHGLWTAPKGLHQYEIPTSNLKVSANRIFQGH